MPIDSAFDMLVTDPRNTLRPVAETSLPKFREAAEAAVIAGAGPAVAAVEDFAIEGPSGPIQGRLGRPPACVDPHRRI